MTGKEKIQAVIDVISEAHQKLIVGNIVEVKSDILSRAGLSIEEQGQALDVLANDKGYIKYTFELAPSISEEDVTPLTGLWLMQKAYQNSESVESVIQQVLESRIYRIEVLDELISMDKAKESSFEDIADEQPTPEVGEKVDDETIVPNELPKTESKSIAGIKVEPNSYDPASGILTIAGIRVQIIKQPNKKGKVRESKQARTMRLVFRDVNSLRNGVPMRTILSVRAKTFTTNHRKRVKSYAEEINEKISEECGIKELLICTQLAVMVDERYL